MSSQVKRSKKRQTRVKNNIKRKNKSQRPKISVYRSNKNTYVQLVDIAGNIIQSFSSLALKKEQSKGVKGTDVARMVGTNFAKSCVDKGIKEVVFDKGAYLYGGRVKAVADSCREAGLKF